MIHFGTSYV
uniref:Uncharacterized protein n=1 Tax=Anguilla anguilla TaxID=7936 RepID=A0A0E9UKU2_ANGAN